MSRTSTGQTNRSTHSSKHGPPAEDQPQLEYSPVNDYSNRSRSRKGEVSSKSRKSRRHRDYSAPESTSSEDDSPSRRSWRRSGRARTRSASPSGVRRPVDSVGGSPASRSRTASIRNPQMPYWSFDPNNLSYMGAPSDNMFAGFGPYGPPFNFPAWQFQRDSYPLGQAGAQPERNSRSSHVRRTSSSKPKPSATVSRRDPSSSEDSDSRSRPSKAISSPRQVTPLRETRRESSSPEERNSHRDRLASSRNAASPVRSIRSAQEDAISLNQDSSDELMREGARYNKTSSSSVSKETVKVSKESKTFEEAEDSAEDDSFLASLSQVYQSAFDTLPEDLCKPSPSSSYSVF